MGLFSRRQNRVGNLEEQLLAATERLNLLDQASGVGLWEAMLVNGDVQHPDSYYRFNIEFRRMLGFESESDFPNEASAWLERVHPEDLEPIVKTLSEHMEDRSGRGRYNIVYRLRTRDGSYRWFRATGGTVHQPDGMTVRTCGSLLDIHDEKVAELRAQEQAARDNMAIEALHAGLSALASGDLTHRITIDFEPKAASLKENFNAAAEKLQEIMRVVASVARNVSDGSRDISQAADDLSRRTEQQAASLEQTAAALDEITAAVRQAAEGATHVARATAAARTDAQSSGTVVEDATAAMSNIEKSSSQIGQIIGVIDEIAFQTNLLALNAGVEAARAGEAGKGFAVVAQEVRELALRSAQAAREIKALVTASSQEVHVGVGLVNQTGTALEGIVRQITEVAGMIDTIAASTREQSAGLHEVNVAVNQMDQVTQQNAAMVEQTSASSSVLAAEADELARLLLHFRIGEEAAANGTRPARRMAA